jgi:hypothetical protein
VRTQRQCWPQTPTPLASSFLSQHSQGQIKVVCTIFSSFCTSIHVIPDIRAVDVQLTTWLVLRGKICSLGSDRAMQAKDYKLNSFIILDVQSMSNWRDFLEGIEYSLKTASIQGKLPTFWLQA